MTADGHEAADAWDGGYEAHERRQREAWLRSTPAQRLEWLEQAIAFAHRAGALGPATGSDDRGETLA